MLQLLREETEGNTKMRLSPRKNCLDSLFKEVRVFKVWPGTKYVLLAQFWGILGALCMGKGAPLVRYLCTT